jgi:hypothetical protein
MPTSSKAGSAPQGLGPKGRGSIALQAADVPNPYFRSNSAPSFS